jgi:hypothetical protein
MVVEREEEGERKRKGGGGRRQTDTMMGRQSGFKSMIPSTFHLLLIESLASGSNVT